MAVTIKDIAQEAGVSFQVVSAVLNDRKGSRASVATRERILEIAERMGYQKNFGYLLMRGQETDTVGIFVSVNYRRYMEQTRQLTLLLTEQLCAMGYASFLHTFCDDARQNRKKVMELLNRGTHACILLGAPWGYRDILKLLQYKDVRYISDSGDYPRHVMYDRSGRLKLLASFKQRFPGCFKVMCQEWETGPEGHIMKDMRVTFPEYSEEEIRRELLYIIPRIDYNGKDIEVRLFQAGAAFTETLMQTFPATQAIYYMNDYFALGGGHYLAGNGWIVGKDIALGGHDAPIAQKISSLPISTVEFDIDSMAKELIAELFTDGPCDKIVPCIVRNLLDKKS